MISLHLSDDWIGEPSGYDLDFVVTDYDLRTHSGQALGVTTDGMILFWEFVGNSAFVGYGSPEAFRSFNELSSFVSKTLVREASDLYRSLHSDSDTIRL